MTAASTIGLDAAAARKEARRADGTVGPLLEIAVPADGELVEPLVELFERHGLGAAIETVLRDETSGGPDEPRTMVRTWVAADDEAARVGIETGLWHLGRIMPIPPATINRLSEANWAERWKEHWTAQEVGPFLVAPSWLPAEPKIGQHVLRLDPGMSFGTGQHPTSRLCLVALADALHRMPGATVLDVGTGSGILAIGAALLGATRVVGVDIDPRAATTAAANAVANGVEIDARAGSLDALAEDEVFGIVVANILAGVIISLAPALLARALPGGLLVASGVLEEQADEVAEALVQAGFGMPARALDGDWVVLVARRPEAVATPHAMHPTRPAVESTPSTSHATLPASPSGRPAMG